MLNVYTINGASHSKGDYTDERTKQIKTYDNVELQLSCLKNSKDPNDLYNFGTTSETIKCTTQQFEEFLALAKIKAPAEAIGKKVYIIYDKSNYQDRAVVNCILPEKCINLAA